MQTDLLYLKFHWTEVLALIMRPVRVVINFNKKDFKDCKFTKEVHRQYNKDKNHN